MPIRIKIATTPGELRSLFEVRHRVYVDQEHAMAPRGGAVVDLYDPLPTTANVCAMVDDTVVGGIRITLDSDAGLPADDFFDFRQHLPSDSRLASCGMMCLLRDTRDNPRLTGSMLKMCMYWAVLHQRTYLFGPVNPAALRVVERIGFRPIGEQFEGPGGLPSIPVTMDLTEMSDEYRAFTDRQDVGLWMENFERVLFSPGEALVTAGEVADHAFLIVEGAVEVRTGELAARAPAVHLRRGHAFGELSLLAPRVRPYTMVALEPTDAMVLRREDFQAQLETRPELAMGLIRSVGTRFEDGLQTPANRLPGSVASPPPRVKSS